MIIGKKIFSSTICLALGIWSLAQTIDPNAVDGKIYVKISDQSSIQIAAFTPNVDLLEGEDNTPKELVEIFQNYQTHSVVSTFPGFDNPRLERTYTIEFDSHSRVEDFLAQLNALPYIEYAEPAALYYIDRVETAYEPNDRRNFNDMYHLDLIDAAEAWDISQGSEEVVIAIVDDAILIDHEDLRGNIWVNPGEIAGNGIDDDRNGYVDDVNGFDVATQTPNPGGLAQLLTHGTQVAGCAAAATDNGTGIASIGFNCKIMAVKATANPSSANNRVVTNGLEGVRYAVSAGADVVNMSFGGSGRNSAFQEILDEGNRRGIVFVSSSGNTGNDEEQFPSSYNHVISVAATGETDRVSGFSTVHSTVDISAPGQSIRTTASSIDLNGYGRSTGTSFSSPIVAGVLGLMKSVNPCATPEELEEILKNSADDISGLNPSFVGKIGAGRVNAARALEASAAPNLPEADFSFDNSSMCSNRIPFTFIQDPDEQACAAVNKYSWEISDGVGFSSTAEGLTPQIEFPESGSYEVRLTVSNAAGSSSTLKTVDITINPSAFIDAGNDTVVCLGDAIQLQSTTSAEITSVQWEPAIGLTATDTITPAFLARQGGGMYTLTIEGADGCILVDSLQIDVFRLPVLRVTPADTSVMAGDSVVLEVRGGLFYEWSPSTGLSDSTISTPLAIPQETTTYTIKTIGAGNCEAEISYTLNVIGDSIGTSLPDFLDGAVISEPLPNPASESVHLLASFPRAVPIEISCFSLEGKRMHTLFSSSIAHSEIDTSWRIPRSLSDGVYWLVWNIGGYKYSQPLLIAR